MQARWSDSTLGLGWAGGGVVADHVSLETLAHAHLLVEASHGVLALKLLKLFRSVLVQELIDTQEAATNTNVDLVIIDFDHDALWAELIDALTFTHKHNLQLWALRVIVDVLSDLLINLVILDGDVDSDSRLQIDNVVLQVLDLGKVILALILALLQLTQQLKALHSWLVELTLEVIDVLWGVG